MSIVKIPAGKSVEIAIGKYVFHGPKEIDTTRHRLPKHYTDGTPIKADKPKSKKKEVKNVRDVTIQAKSKSVSPQGDEVTSPFSGVEKRIEDKE